MIDDLKRLDSIDLSRISVGDIRQMKNEKLKKSLMDAVESKATASDHLQHISHTDHCTSPEEQLPPR